MMQYYYFHFLICIQLYSVVIAFVHLQGRTRADRKLVILLTSEDEDAPSLDNKDWREFRARLVLGGESKQEGDSSSWAYDSGNVIEPGSIILSKVDPDFCYFGLNQQYFHKCMILVTHHDEYFTKGIILNRPTNLFLGDADFLNVDGEPYIKPDGEESIKENSWQIWFGGDVRGLYSENSEINCLHSIDTESSRSVSEVLMNNIMMTNYEGATQIIKKGEASASDFWMFAGSCGWTGGQLLDELNRDSWYMVSAAQSTVWKELIRQRDEGSDPREAGIQTWYTFMDLIGKKDEAKLLSESFADLTLKEYCTEHLLFNSTNEESDQQEDVNSLDLNDLFSSFSSTPDTLDKIVKLALNARNGLAGTLLRGSSNERSPFTLIDQKFHKSTLLILQDDDELTVAMLLNHPSTKTRPITLPNGRIVEMVVRYGGSFGIPGVIEQPTMFLHNKSKLKKLNIGEAIGNSEVLICTEEQVIEAVSEGFASHKDFMVIEGFSIWSKEDGEGGILNDILEQKFEVVEPEFTDEIWVTLLAQAPLSIDTLDRNCRM